MFLKNKIFVMQLLILIFFSACMMIRPLEIKESPQIQVKDISFTAIKLSLTVKVRNPNFFPIKIGKSQLQLEMDKIPLGEISLPEKTKLLPYISRELQIPVQVGLSGVMPKVLAIITTSDKLTLSLRVKGNTSVRGLFMSKNMEIDSVFEIKFRNK